MNVENLFKLGKTLLVLLGSFLVGLFLASGLSSLAEGWWPDHTRGVRFLQATLQSIFAFILPACVAMRLESGKPLKALGLERGTSIAALLAVAALWTISLPAMNQIIFWNAGMHLPDTFHAIEESWRRMEEQNASFTAQLMSGTSVADLLTGILVVGCLTGLGEELFFRGAFQGSLTHCGVGRNVAVWTAAVVFSLMHFQMFGFVPRLLMGLWFGYLYLWSGSIWLSTAAHALNNSMCVLMAWLANRSAAAASAAAGAARANLSGADSIGVAETGIPWLALASALVFTLALLHWKKYLVGRQAPGSQHDARPL